MEHKFGLLCGRFQPVHKGHVKLIRCALEHCDHLIIAIGSAQESRTKKNPFSFEERRELLRRSLWGLNKKVTIIPVDDRKQIRDDSAWGGYLYNEVVVKTCVCPTINFSGKEEIRSHWFDTVHIEQMELDREETPISATQVREAILNDDFDTFSDLVPNGLLLKFKWMNKVLKEIENDER